MPRERFFFILFVTLCWLSPASATDVSVCTDAGRIIIELFDEDAPLHVANFLDYTDRGFYGGTVFHRVIQGFVIQGGGFDKDLRGKRPSRTVPNESRNGHKNERGTVAAARATDPDSASSQFFINLTDNVALDATRREPGYTVFGQVTDGMAVVNEIARLPTGASGGFASDVPDPLMSTTSITRLGAEQFSDIPYMERHELIGQEINSALAVDDQASAFEWFTQLRNSCGVMSPDLLITESQVALALGNETAAVAALEEYLRVAEDTHADYAVALQTYLGLLPEAPVTLSEQLMIPSLAQLAGHCITPENPNVPNGQTASMDEMIAGQTTVRAYMATSNGYLECLAEIIDKPDLAQEQRALLESKYNQTIDAMEAVAENFNEQVKLIRERE